MRKVLIRGIVEHIKEVHDGLTCLTMQHYPSGDDPNDSITIIAVGAPSFYASRIVKGQHIRIIAEVDNDSG